MELFRKIQGDVRYCKRLAAAGWQGLLSAGSEVEGSVFSPTLRRIAWAPMAAGAALGAVGARRRRGGRGLSAVAVGGAVGTVVGFAAAAAWASRRVAGAAARKAVRRMNDVRDARWLELNPIDYA